MMKPLQYSLKLLISFAFFLLLVSKATALAQPENCFRSCLLSSNDTMISSIIYFPENSSFLSVLDSNIRNLRYLSPEIPKPKAILRPFNESHVQRAIICGRSCGLEMRVRSGGHDFVGSSYISPFPFFVLDTFDFRSISVDAASRTAWVGVGATLGETFYGIYQANSSLAFSAGYWPTVGVGGHIGGGGYGPLTRQYGLSADNVIDALLVDVNGTVHDRESMGEDLFWAIRGGIGSNFGVILAYKLSLVEIPEKVTAFYVNRTLEQNAIQLVYKWQYVAPKLPIDLTLSVKFGAEISNQTGNATILASFLCVYRGGGIDELLSIMGEHFPELGLTEEDCTEMLWIQYYLFHTFDSIDNFEEFLTSRSHQYDQYLAGKGDFVKDPIPEEGLEEILYKLLEVPPAAGAMEWTIFRGGIMDEIPETEIPFPHRGSLFVMFEGAFWSENDTSDVIQSRINWVRGLHDVIGRYVPSNPRPAYADYRDLDLGVNNPTGETSIEQARIWGAPYFKDNFDRLVKVKTQVDPENYLKCEQCFPVLPADAFS